MDNEEELFKLWLEARDKPKSPLTVHASFTEKTKIYAIGDVHGMFNLLKDAHEWIAAHADGQPAVIVHVGDYVDRGPDSEGCIALLRAGSKVPNITFVCLKGNHEDMMLAAFDDPRELFDWLPNGGKETLASYGLDQYDVRDLPVHDIQWLRTLPLSYQTQYHFFVHAGIYPEVELDKQSPETMMWIREEFLWSNKEHGKLIVHGHTPSDTVQSFVNRLGIDTGATFGGALSVAVFDSDARACLGIKQFV